MATHVQINRAVENLFVHNSFCMYVAISVGQSPTSRIVGQGYVHLEDKRHLSCRLSRLYKFLLSRAMDIMRISSQP